MEAVKAPKDSVEMKGFGEHNKPIHYSKYRNAKIIYDISVAILLCGIIGTGVAASLAIVSVSSAAILTLPLAAAVIYAAVHYQGCRNAFGPLNAIIKSIIQPTKLGESTNCDVLACEDTVESFEWKKKLIEAANHNIVLSGNYCGSNTFDEILNLIKTQMTLKSELKVVILSSDKFITKQNHKLLKELSEVFGDRFQLVETPDIYHVNPGLKKTTNHTKSLSIDFGDYFLLGGSGLEDKYAHAKGLGDRGSKESQEIGGLLGMFLPRGFRDQDFVFCSHKDNGVGKRVYVESLKLAARWERLNDSKDTNSVTKKLLLEETRTDRPEIKGLAHIKEFHESEKISKLCKTKVFCMGPEHAKNHFEKEIITRINHAKKRIVIDHMYFHPTKAVLDALAKAAERNVKIKIITNGFNEKASPAAHRAFAPRNRYNYAALKNAVNLKAKKNITVYEFKVRKTTLHKKVMVVDDYVIAGSSNLGYKSLVTMSDHEMNFVSKNRKLADATVKIAEVDARVDYVDENGNEVKGFARKVNNFDIDWKTAYSAAQHRAMAPLIG